MLAAAPFGFAQESLSLQDAVKSALEHHPRLAAEAARITVSDGLIQQAGLHPNPRLFIQSENWNVGNPSTPIASAFTDQFFYASQVVETAGKATRRVEVAQANRAAVTQDLAVMEREVTARVKWAYWQAVGAQNIVELLRDSHDNWQQVVQYHEIQVREGAIPEADLIRVRVEERRASVNLESAIRDAQAARLALLREMGESGDRNVVLTERLDGLPLGPNVDVEAAVAKRADVVRAQRSVSQAQSNLRMQEAYSRPDVEVLGGYKRTVGFNTAMWGVQVSLPLWNKNQGNIAAAASDIHSAQATVTAAETQARAEIIAAQRDVETRRDRLSSLTDESLQVASQSVEIARAAYRESGIDLLRLLDAERTFIELKVMNARLHMEYHQSLVTLETALGVNP